MNSHEPYKHKILVVGQTPPPYGGQAIMIQKMLEGSYPNAKLFHVRMGFSSQMDEIGKVRVRKIWHLLQLILRTYYMGFRHNIRVLYYPPAGPDLAPILRDIVFLISVRWLFRTQIFHFHAAGLSEFYIKSTGLLRRLMELAYLDPDIAIRQSRETTEDGRAFRAKREYVFPCGVEDHDRGGEVRKRRVDRDSSNLPTILYVGVLREDKGVLVLLDALRLLHQRGRKAYLQLVGHFGSDKFQLEVNDFIQQNGLSGVVRLRGVLTGDDKWQAFGEADMFCFPSFFSAESFGVCLVEAQSFSLPIVATCWRGIPEIVDEGENGFLVPVRNSAAVADQLERLLADVNLREEMGRSGRAKFEREFTLARFHRHMNSVFQSIDLADQPHAIASDVA